MIRGGVILLVALVAACGDLVPPARPDPYDVGIRLNDGFELRFYWTPASLPVRFWIEPEADLPTDAPAAIEAWEAVALLGEFRGVVVADSAAADVLIIRAEEIDIGGNGAARSDCLGQTAISVELDTTVTLPFVIKLFPRRGASPTSLRACLRTTVAHEIGHTLGLFLHSDAPDDLMYAPPRVGRPSDRDVASFTALYHSTPSVRLPAGR